jgi:hypothetical protein
MNISKNQVWVLIAIVGVGVIALVSDIEIKVEVGTEDYATEPECILREAQACQSDACVGDARRFCKTLDYPE